MQDWKKKIGKVAGGLRTGIMRQSSRLPFVFVIGFNKTATTTIHGFFEKNGFPCVHWDNNRLATTMLENCMHDRRILSGYDRKYRVFSDMIVQTQRIRFEGNSLFRILDTDYPGAYFIYNHRPMPDWLASRWKKPCRKYRCTNIELEMRILNTQDPQDVVDAWKRTRVDFEQEVRKYFAGNKRFLELDIRDSEAPCKLSRLLGIDLDPAHWGLHVTNSTKGQMTDRIAAFGPCPPARI